LFVLCELVNMAVSLPSLACLSLKSVATVFCSAGLGAYARHAKLLTKEVETGLDKLISSVFLPALILEKVTPNMNMAELFAIWPLIIMCIFVVFYGLASGAIAQRAVLGRESSYGGLVMVAIAFPNSFSVPLTLLLAVGDHPVLLMDGQKGGDALVARINLLFLMSYSVWVLARWSIGYPILSGALTFSKWREKVLNPPVVACLVAGLGGLAWNEIPVDSRPSTAYIEPMRTALSYGGRCSVPIILIQLGARLHAAISEVTSKSVVAVQDPLLPREDVEASAKMPQVAYWLIFVLRQIVGPIFGAFIACGVLRTSLGVRDPVVLMVGMLQSAGPPMINLSVMAGLSGSAEKEVAKVILLTYSLSVVTWTLSMALFFHVLQ